jgi:hypothetical protein
MKAILKIVFFFFILTSLFVVSVEAKVFRRWGGANDGIAAVGQLGGKKLYESSVTINGGKGNLAVFGFDKPASEVCALLGSAFKNNNLKAKGNSGAIVHIPTSDGILKLVILEPLVEKGQTVVFAIEQSNSDSEISQKQPTSRLLDILSDYPDARLVFSGKIDQSRTTVEILSVSGNPESVKVRASSYMHSAGWRNVVETENSQLKSRLPKFGGQMYYKNMDLCYVQTLPGTHPDESIIVLLHKRIMSE